MNTAQKGGSSITYTNYDFEGKTFNFLNDAMPSEIFEKLKEEGKFDNGFGIVGGLIHRGKHKGKHLIMIDCDNQNGINAIFSLGIEKAKNQTLIEQHLDDLTKCHAYFITNRKVRKISPSDNSDVKVEVKGAGSHGVHFASPSIHKDGHPYEIISDVIEPKYIDADEFENALRKLGFYKKFSESTSEKIENLKNKVEGTNRQGDLLSICTTFALKNKGMVDEDDVVTMAKKLNSQLGDPYPENRAIEIGRSAYQYSLHDSKLSKNWDVVKNPDATAEEKEDAKKQINILEEKLGKEKTNWRDTKTEWTWDSAAKHIMSKISFATLSKTNQILTFDGKRYSEDEALSQIKNELERMVPHESKRFREEVIDKIKIRTQKKIEIFNADVNLLNLDNGSLDLDSMSLHPHSPDNLTTIVLPIQYEKPLHEIHDETIFADIEKNLDDTLFWKFIKSSFTIDGKFDRKSFETALEVIASVFIKQQIDAKAVILLGNGENGKSVFLSYIESLVGEENKSNIQLQSLAEDRFLSSNLKDKHVNIFADLESNELRKAGLIKAIITNEGITAQKKHGHPFTFNPFCKLMFSCNRFPKVYDQSQGFFRRWIILKWNRNFENDPERDEHLLSKLISNTGEKNKVFSTLIHLSKKLLKDGKFSHSVDWRTTQREWNANADPISDFVDNYTKDSDSHTSVRDMHSFYKEIMYEKGEKPLGVGQFGRIFAEYYDQSKNDGTRIWMHVEMKKPIQAELKEYDTAC